jgi:hypothetical protein
MLTTKTTTKTQAEVDRTRAVLVELVEASGVSQEILAQGMEMKPADLGALLREGCRDLSVIQLLQILDLIQLSPEVFFGKLYRLMDAVDMEPRLAGESDELEPVEDAAARLAAEESLGERS